jgi:hypothetical protein
MLDSDNREAAEEMTRTYADKPIPQFWDGEQLLGKEVNRSLGTPTERAAWASISSTRPTPSGPIRAYRLRPR